MHVESYDEAVALGPPHKLLLMCEDVDEVVSAALETLPTNLCKVVRGSPPFFVEFLQQEVGAMPAPCDILKRVAKLLPMQNRCLFRVHTSSCQVNKGEGLRRLCEALGVPCEEVVAFGDGDNDIEFLQQVRPK